MKILVVDDDELAVEMVCTILEACNYQTLVGANVIEGFAQLEAHPDIAIVISDMNMPLVSGLEFLQELRAQQNSVPFVLLTGDQPEVLLAREHELKYCLEKSFELAETLPLLIQEIVGSRS